jgi:hypothetical protein
MDRNAIDSRVIVPGHNSSNQSFFSNPDCSALVNSSLKSARVIAEKVQEGGSSSIFEDQDGIRTTVAPLFMSCEASFQTLAFFAKPPPLIKKDTQAEYAGAEIIAVHIGNKLCIQQNIVQHFVIQTQAERRG